MTCSLEENRFLVWPDEFLGEGSVGRVFVGFDKKLNRDCVVKVVDLEDLDPSVGLNALYQGIEALASVAHDHLVPFCGGQLSADGLSVIIATEKMTCNLADILAEGPALDEPSLAHVARSVLGGLSALHSRGMAHKSMKEDNILFAQDGTVKLSDFCLAGTVVAALGSRRAALYIGSPCFTAPEATVDDDEYDGSTPEADIWALGIALYIAFTGKSPYNHAEHPVRVLVMVRDEAAPRLPSAVGPAGVAPSAELADLVERCLQKDPRDRPTAAQLLSHPFFSKYTPPARGAAPLALIRRIAELTGLRRTATPTPDLIAKERSNLSVLLRQLSPAPLAIPAAGGAGAAAGAGGGVAAGPRARSGTPPPPGLPMIHVSGLTSFEAVCEQRYGVSPTPTPKAAYRSISMTPSMPTPTPQQAGSPTPLPSTSPAPEAQAQLQQGPSPALGLPPAGGPRLGSASPPGTRGPAQDPRKSSSGSKTAKAAAMVASLARTLSRQRSSNGGAASASAAAAASPNDATPTVPPAPGRPPLVLTTPPAFPHLLQDGMHSPLSPDCVNYGTIMAGGAPIPRPSPLQQASSMSAVPPPSTSSLTPPLIPRVIIDQTTEVSIDPCLTLNRSDPDATDACRLRSLRAALSLPCTPTPPPSAKDDSARALTPSAEKNLLDMVRSRSKQREHHVPIDIEEISSPPGSDSHTPPQPHYFRVDKSSRRLKPSPDAMVPAYRQVSSSGYAPPRPAELGLAEEDVGLSQATEEVPQEAAVAVDGSVSGESLGVAEEAEAGPESQTTPSRAASGQEGFGGGCEFEISFRLTPGQALDPRGPSLQCNPAFNTSIPEEAAPWDPRAAVSDSLAALEETHEGSPAIVRKLLAARAALLELDDACPGALRQILVQSTVGLTGIASFVSFGKPPRQVSTISTASGASVPSFIDNAPKSPTPSGGQDSANTSPVKGLIRPYPSETEAAATSASAPGPAPAQAAALPVATAAATSDTAAAATAALRATVIVGALAEPDFMSSLGAGTGTGTGNFTCNSSNYNTLTGTGTGTRTPSDEDEMEAHDLAPSPNGPHHEAGLRPKMDLDLEEAAWSAAAEGASAAEADAAACSAPVLMHMPEVMAAPLTRATAPYPVDDSDASISLVSMSMSLMSADSDLADLPGQTLPAGVASSPAPAAARQALIEDSPPIGLNPLSTSSRGRMNGEEIQAAAAAALASLNAHSISAASSATTSPVPSRGPTARGLAMGATESDGTPRNGSPGDAAWPAGGAPHLACGSGGYRTGSGKRSASPVVVDLSTIQCPLGKHLGLLQQLSSSSSGSADMKRRAGVLSPPLASLSASGLSVSGGRSEARSAAPLRLPSGTNSGSEPGVTTVGRESLPNPVTTSAAAAAAAAGSASASGRNGAAERRSWDPACSPTTALLSGL